MRRTADRHEATGAWCFRHCTLRSTLEETVWFQYRQSAWSNCKRAWGHRSMKLHKLLLWEVVLHGVSSVLCDLKLNTVWFQFCATAAVLLLWEVVLHCVSSVLCALKFNTVWFQFCVTSAVWFQLCKFLGTAVSLTGYGTSVACLRCSSSRRGCRSLSISRIALEGKKTKFHEGKHAGLRAVVNKGSKGHL